MNDLFLLADLDGALVKVIIALIVGAFWVVSRIAAANEERKRKQRQANRPPRMPQAEVVDIDERQPAQGGQFADEIEEFLKKAAVKRGGAPKPAPAARQPGERQPGRKRQQAQRRPRPSAAPAQPEPRGEAIFAPTQAALRKQNESVAEHVQSHLDTREFTERAAHLTTVDQADEQLQAHLQQVFSHEVGTLHGSSIERQGGVAAATVAAQAAAPGGLSIAALLADPQNMKSAILLNEILQRPEHRWS